MKKIIVGFIAFVMILGLVACNQSAEDKVAGYVDEAEEKLEEMFGKDLVDFSVRAEGCGIIVDMKFKDIDDVSAEQKRQIQSTYDSMDSTFESMLDEMQEEVPEMEYMVMNVCEKDGDLIAKVEIGK